MILVTAPVRLFMWNRIDRLCKWPKTFSASRNAGVLAQIPLAISISHGLGTLNGYPRTTVANATLPGSNLA